MESRAVMFFYITLCLITCTCTGLECFIMLLGWTWLAMDDGEEIPIVSTEPGRRCLGVSFALFTIFNTLFFLFGPEPSSLSSEERGKITKVNEKSTKIMMEKNIDTKQTIEVLHN